MLPTLLLLVALTTVAHGGIERPGYFEGDVILYSPTVTNWGQWQPWEDCSVGNYVVGMQLKNEGYGGIFDDDTALNGIKFFCGPIGYRYNNASITSGVNVRGSFGREGYCEGVATGFQLRSEKDQTALADDTAANNLRLFCNNNRQKHVEGDGLTFGDWTLSQDCFSKQALCGIQTQVEMEHGNGDETALNNVNMKCCDVPDPGAECEPNDEWDLLIECDNTEAVTPTTCTYERKIGISYSNTESESHYDQTVIYHEIGFSLDAAPAPLSLNFGYNFGYSQNTGYNWTITNTEVWSVETKTSVEFEVPPKVSTQLLQTLGKCGIYNARATRVKRIDTEAETLTETVTYIEI